MDLPIIFIHKDDSFYLKYALENAKRFNPNSKIILLGKNIKKYPSFVEYHKISDYHVSATKFAKKYVHRSNNLEEIERFCFERWFILSEFMTKNKINRCLIIDSDVLLYVDATKEIEKFSNYKFTFADHTCGHVTYVLDSRELKKLVNFISSFFTDKKLSKIFEKYWSDYKKYGTGKVITDMAAINEYCIRNKKKVFEITSIINNETYDRSINLEQDMIMDNGIKKIVFEDGVPYGFLKSNKIKVKLCCLHFSGPTKFYMKSFSKGKVTIFDKKLAKVLVYLRDHFAHLFSSNVRKSMKKILIKIGV